MAKYNIYGHVLYSEIEYEKLMNMTEKNVYLLIINNRVPSINGMGREYMGHRPRIYD